MALRLSNDETNADDRIVSASAFESRWSTSLARTSVMVRSHPETRAKTAVWHAATESVLTDFDLVDRARRGETWAFSELVIRHQSQLFRIACAIVRSRDAAEDVMQNAWLHAYRNI